MCSYFLTSGTVSIKDRTVTLTCPSEEGVSVTWQKEKDPRQEKTKDLQLLDYNDKSDGLYSCSFTIDETLKSHYFYIKAKGK